MKISWVLSDRLELDPTQDIQALKNVGPFWGSWRTWRAYQTDNVICHSQFKASELIQRNFQTHCNFYIPKSVYSALDQPTSVGLYEGEFMHDLDHHEEIVALHLAATDSDIVLLLGYDLSEQEKMVDKLQEHKAHNYRSLLKQAIKNFPTVQWVWIDHAGHLRKDLTELENLTTDTMVNVIEMLST